MRRTVLFLLSILLLPGVTQAQAIAVNIDSGVSERGWLSPTPKPPLDLIIFTWLPTRLQQDTLYFLEAFCDQLNVDGQPSGKNKVTFQNVVLLGVDSDNSLSAVKQSKRIKNGIGRLAAWDLMSGVDAFQTDSAVLVAMEIKANKPVRGDDALMLLTCQCSVAEIIDPGSLQTASSEERLRYYRQTFGNRRHR